MTQQVVKTRVLMPMTSSVEDTSSFDLYWEATGSNASLTLSEIYTVISNFLENVVTGQSFAVSQYLSNDISRVANAVQFQTTDITAHLDGTPAGSPIDVATHTLGPASLGNAMPEGVAMCIGYRADYGTALEHGPMQLLPSDEDAIDQGAPPTHLGRTRPRAQLRGRIYLGPLNSGAFGTLHGVSGAVGGQFAPQFNTDLGLAFDAMAQTQRPLLADQFNLVQWSRRGAAVNAVRHYYLNEYAASRRNRADTTVNRVHNWVTV